MPDFRTATKRDAMPFLWGVHGEKVINAKGETVFEVTDNRSAVHICVEHNDAVRSAIQSSWDEAANRVMGM